MGADHPTSAAVSAGGRHRTSLIAAFCLTATYMVVELIAGVTINSLALISDAAHMATDVLGLGMALAAITLAARPGSARRTYGFYRLEVLAALANGILLFAVAGFVLVDAIKRFQEPAEVPGTPLFIVAVVGLLVNVVSFRLLMAGSKESLNLKGAYLEVLGDLLGSLGVIVAAIILITTGWQYADPIIGVGIGLFILPRTWTLTRQALAILMESAPARIAIPDVERRITSLPGVEAVHDLHVWTITSGMESASGHIVIDNDASHEQVLEAVVTLLRDDYDIVHTTIQCESSSFEEAENPV